MKQVNDLLILEIPKSATDFEIKEKEGVKTVVYTEFEHRWNGSKLPEGNWEVIGTLTQAANSIAIRDAVLDAAKQEPRTMTRLLKAECLYSRMYIEIYNHRIPKIVVIEKCNDGLNEREAHHIITKKPKYNRGTMLTAFERLSRKKFIIPKIPVMTDREKEIAKLLVLGTLYPYKGT